MHGLYPLIFFLSCSLADSHLPVFPATTSAHNPYNLPFVTQKSYGVYGELGETDIVWLEVDGIKGQEMSISLQRNNKGGVFDAVVWGVGLDNVTCGGENWYGWSSSHSHSHASGGHFFTRNLTDLPAVVLDAIGSSEAFVLHGDGKEPAEFEPFGVGIYWPLAGCKDSFPETAKYRIALVNPTGDSVGFSVGLGMVESFSLRDLFLIPFVLYRTFVWSGRSSESVFGIFLLSLSVFYAFKLVSLQRNSYTLIGQRPLLTISIHLLWICAAAFFASGVSFLFQLIICFTVKPDLGAVVAVPLIVHIFLPITFSLLIFFFFEINSRLWVKIGALLACCYMLCFGWMAFLVFPAFGIVSVFVCLFF